MYLLKSLYSLVIYSDLYLQIPAAQLNFIEDDDDDDDFSFHSLRIQVARYFGTKILALRNILFLKKKHR